jgi:hypothetical protein
MASRGEIQERDPGEYKMFFSRLPRNTPVEMQVQDVRL